MNRHTVRCHHHHDHHRRRPPSTPSPLAPMTRASLSHCFMCIERSSVWSKGGGESTDEAKPACTLAVELPGHRRDEQSRGRGEDSTQATDCLLRRTEQDRRDLTVRERKRCFGSCTGLCLLDFQTGAIKTQFHAGLFLTTGVWKAEAQCISGNERRGFLQEAFTRSPLQHENQTIYYPV